MYKNTCCSPPSAGQSYPRASPSVLFGSTGASAPAEERWPTWIAESGHYSEKNGSACWKKKRDTTDEIYRMLQWNRIHHNTSVHNASKWQLILHLFSISCSSSWTLWQSSSAGAKLLATFIKRAATLLLHNKPAIRRFSPWSTQASTTAVRKIHSISQY